MCKFFGDAHRLLWVDPQQVLENGEERDFLRGVPAQKYLQIYLQTSNWCQEF